MRIYPMLQDLLDDCSHVDITESELAVIAHCLERAYDRGGNDEAKKQEATKTI